MQEILDLARRLGEAIAASDRFAATQQLRQRLQADPTATGLLKDFQEQAARIARLEAENKPVEVEDKHKLENLQQQIAAHDLLKEWMRVQADYAEMMNRVNRAMSAPLAPKTPPAEPAEPPAPTPQPPL